VARQVERNRRLLDLGAVPQKDYELSVAEQRGLEENIRSHEATVASIEAQLRRFGVPDSSPGQLITTEIAAPFAGVITKAIAAPGEVVDSEDELFTVADLSRVWVQAEVYEKDLGRIQIGQNAIIQVDTYPDVRFTGKVTYISDVLDSQTRSARVRSEVPNPGVLLKVDMFARVQVPTKLNRMAIAIPLAALQQVKGRDVVFVRAGETKFEARAVRVGNTVGPAVEVISGINEGERVVTEGAFHLKSIMVGKELGEDVH
jgi:cobalt-zinc-cadmium efflux system membrane fusion protein